jgi:signal transduction histidine kinase
LNDILLRLDLRERPVDRSEFQAESGRLGTWIRVWQGRLQDPRMREIFTAVGQAYETYLASSDGLITEMDTVSDDVPLEDHFVRIETHSQQLLGLAAELMTAQREALKRFVADAHQSTVQLQHLLFVSLFLLLALAFSAAFLVYRGMIAPLRGELRESRALIARQEKLASLGTLAAGVAHEIRNPLTAIKVRLFGLQRHLPAGSSEREDTRIIGDELSRLERIVRDFLQFARPSDPEFEVIEGGALLEEVCGLLRSQTEPRGIRLATESKGSAPVRVDPRQMKQVLINLVQNAADSLEGPGVVTLRLATAVRPLPRGAGPAVLLEVSDTGKGIPREVQERLFDPFFTTKEGGTGLGLSIAARIVEMHGGLLQYRTQLNQGTTFTVVLPAATAHETDCPDLADRG